MSSKPIGRAIIGMWSLTLIALVLGPPSTRSSQAIGGTAGRIDPLSFSTQQKGEVSDKPAEEVYQNIQIFNGASAASVMRAMAFFKTALGVDCNHCHVPNQFEKDDLPAKQTARKMYEMVRLSNKQLETNKVTCYTCHRGHVQPEPPPDSWKPTEDQKKQALEDKRPAEQVYKNIQLLKGVPASRWMIIMNMFSKSLGVDCTYCHVPGEFDKDDKPAKLAARRMLRMVGAISREIYKGPNPVNCYTCHRGHAEPVSLPAK